MIHIDCSREYLDWSKYDLSKDEVYIIDNLFPGWFVHYVDDLIMTSYDWFWGHSSGYAEDGRDVGADPEWPEVPALKQQIFPPRKEGAQDSCYRMIYSAVMSSIPFEVELGEILINGQQYIHNTNPHQDCPCDNGLSFCYYVNKQWDQEWGGELMVKLNDEWTGIPPSPGRVIFFKGNIWHHGLPPNEKYRGLRSSLVYKTMRKVPLPEK
jgi:hypothetical protein|tara:strand:- start:2005 stop:2634 length:630 start_codon:yes stop_codon:yes gene_type:complete